METTQSLAEKLLDQRRQSVPRGVASNHPVFASRAEGARLWDADGKEYLDFGVPAVWLVDPEEKKVWIYRQTGMEEASGNTLRVDGTDLEFPLSEIFD